MGTIEENIKWLEDRDKKLEEEQAGLSEQTNPRASRKLFKEEYRNDKAQEEYTQRRKERTKNLNLSAQLGGKTYTGNIDLDNRKVLKNGDNIATENSITVGFDDEYVIIPTVINGKQMSRQYAKAYYKKTGEHLGKYGTPEEANDMANRIHLRQAEKYMPTMTKAEDYGRSLMMGFSNLYDTAGYALGEAGEALDPYSDAIRLFAPLYPSSGLQDLGASMREDAQFATKYWEEGMSDRAKELMKQAFLVEKNGHIDYEESFFNLLKNPAKAGLSAIQSLPATGAGMALGGFFAKAFSLVPKIGGSVASAMGFGLGEGALSALDTGKNTEDKVLAMPIEQLRKHPEFQIALYATNGNEEEARKLVADASGDDARALTMLTTTIFSSPIGLIFEPLFLGNQAIASTFFKSWALGALGETGQEVPQSAFEQLWSNYAVQKNADQSQKLFEGVPEAIAQALVTAPILGGGFGGASTQAQNVQQKTTELSDVTSRYLFDKAGDAVNSYFDSKYSAVPKMFVPSEPIIDEQGNETYEEGAVSDMLTKHLKVWISNKDAKIDLSKLVKPLNKIEGLLKRKYNFLENKVATREIEPYEADEMMSNYLNDLKGKYLESARLEEVLTFPELFKREPWMKDIKVTFDPNLSGSSAYSPVNKDITLGQEDLGALLHESQHTIQDKYEWAGGGGSDGINPESLVQTLRELAGDQAPPIWAELDARREAGTIEAKEYYETFINEGTPHLEGGLSQLEYITYRRIYGEQEARVNQAVLEYPDMLPWEAIQAKEGRLLRPLVHINGKLQSFSEKYGGGKAKKGGQIEVNADLNQEKAVWKNIPEPQTEGVVKMASEALPSTDRVEGEIIKKMPLEAQTEYHRGVQQIMTDEYGVDFAIKDAGLVELDTIETPSHYQHHIGVSEQTDIGGFKTLSEDTISRLRLVASIKGFVQDQDGVTLRWLVKPQSEDEINSAMIDVGRVLTDEEMRSVSSALEKAGYGEDYIALATTDYGVDLINFSGLDLKGFKEAVAIIDKIFPNTEYSYTKNLFADNGYVGGFSWQEGNKIYEEIINGSTIHTRETSQGEQEGSYLDYLKEKREQVRAFTRAFIRAERNRNGGAKNLAQIGRESDQEVIDAGEQFGIEDHSDRAFRVLSNKLYNKADKILKGGDKQALTWYADFQKAMDDLSKDIKPLKSKKYRKLFTAITAIVSDGSDVYKNLSDAVYTFNEYLKDKSVVHESPHPRQASHKKNLQKLQNLINEKGLEKALDWMLEQSQVKDIAKSIGQKNIQTLYQKDYYPNSVMFGAKVGMFYANLAGNPDYITMDRWWARMFNRLRGISSQRPTKTQYDRFKKALGRQRMSEEKMDKVADEIVKRWSKSDRGLTKGTELELSANAIVKANTELLMQPKNAGDRAFQMKVATEVLNQLKENGFPDMTLADLQATMWYGEKRAMFARGSNRLIEDDFLIASNRIVSEGLYSNDAWNNIPAPEPTSDQNFKKFFGKSYVVDEDGKPLQVYHGTTNSFDTFSNDNAQVEANYGKAFYFTDSQLDVNHNYASNEGGDLGVRIEREADRIVDMVEDENPELSADEAYDEALKRARESISEGKPNVMPVYLSIQNPVIVDKKGSQWFEIHYTDEEGEFLDEPYGKGIEILDALRNRIEQDAWNGAESADLIMGYLWDDLAVNDSFSAYDLERSLRNEENFQYLENEEGNLINRQILRDAYEDAGFDGIIVRNVEDRFPNMLIEGDSSHYIVFKPEQIKSVNNRGTWSNQESNVLYSNPILGVADFLLVQAPEPFFKLIRGANRFMDKHLTGKLDDTWLDKFVRKYMLGSLAGGLGSLSLEQERAFTKHYRRLQSAKSSANIDAETQAKIVEDSTKEMEKILVNTTAIRYLENPEARLEISKNMPEMAEALDEVRETIDALSREAMERGLITQSQYDKWEGRYLSRLYATYKPEVVGKTKAGIKMEDIKAGRRIDSLIDYLEANPKEAERLNPVLDAQLLIKMTIAKTQSNIGLDDFFRGIVDFEGMVDDKMLVSLPEQVEKLPMKFSPAYAEKVVIPYLDDLNLEFRRGLEDATKRANDLEAQIERAGTSKDLFGYVDKLKQQRYEVLDEKEKWSKDMEYYDNMIKDLQAQIVYAKEYIQNDKENKKTSLIPENKNYGVIAGLSLNNDIASLVKDQFAVGADPETIVEKADHWGRKLLTYYKWSKVPANLFSYPRNFTSNFGQWSISGANPTAFFPEWGISASDYANGGKWYQMARRGGMLETNNVSAEVLDSLRVIAGNLKPDAKVQQFVVKAMEKIGGWYGLVDDISKIARMKYGIEKEGLSVEEAIEVAQSTHHDYSLTYAVIRGMRNPDMTKGMMLKLLGTLFPTYTQKTIALMWDTFKHRPVTLAMITGALNLLIHGGEDDDKKEIGEEKYNEIMKTLPDWAKNNSLMKIDMERDPKTKQIKVTLTDVSYVVPWGNLSAFMSKMMVGEVAGAFGELGLGGSPFQMLSDLKTNVDSFTGKEIYYKHDWWEGGKDVTKYLATQFAPATITKILNLMDTRHPWKIRLAGINSYEYTADELATWNEYRAKEIPMDAGKKAMEYKRKIQQADRDLAEGKISRPEHYRIVKSNTRKILYWKDLGEKGYQEQSIRSTPYKNYNSIAKRIRSAVREMREYEKEAKKAKGNRIPLSRFRRDKEKMDLVRKYESVKKIDREIGKIRKRKEELERKRMSEEQREKVNKKLDDRMDAIYSRGYKLLK